MTTVRKEKQSGFTLIELLVVIAIIAIIAAFLFAAFAGVREKGRQTTVLSNFEKIQRGLGEYQLDQHRYPEVLFAYAGNYPGSTMATPYETDSTKPKYHDARKGLFPRFIQDPAIFIDPNNPDASDTTTSTGNVSTNTVTNGVVTPATSQFFKADSYDVSPQMSDASTLKPATYVARYQKQWVTIPGAPVPPATQRQLAFPSPPGDTFVTCTTYHVPKGVVLALFLNGSAKTIDSKKYYQETGNTDTNFWKVTPSGL